MRRSLLPLLLGALLPLAAIACGNSASDAQKTAESAINDAVNDTNVSTPSPEEAQRQMDEMKKQMADYAERLKGDIKSQAQEAREGAMATLVGTTAQGEFARRGVTLQGAMGCTAESPAIGKYHVDCDGVTDDNKPAKLVGDDKGDGQPAVFVGSVEGKEVFRQGCIAIC